MQRYPLGSRLAEMCYCRSALRADCVWSELSGVNGCAQPAGEEGGTLRAGDWALRELIAGGGPTPGRNQLGELSDIVARFSEPIAYGVS
ncbi:hypothetical protein CA85_47660 [Allorhodopirellula solitaria]|uniref:Uncharacterized protein n=1 Tax=Allorhodopirellula solitaria TaxID=2527987 RepID=A0A5C5WZ31_9BACT|nr:hypothetical protein CA85_47660 [Allorhodopirellula solitaria]